MEKKQSSIEWLEIELEKLWFQNHLSPITIKPLFEQAKEMHQQEIEDAYDAVIVDENGGLLNGKEYYLQTFADQKKRDNEYWDAPDMGEIPFNLQKFIGSAVYALDGYFNLRVGWESVSCFNDFWYVWVNRILGKSVIAKIQMVDDEFLLNEIVYEIKYIDGIYGENI